MLKDAFPRPSPRSQRSVLRIGCGGLLLLAAASWMAGAALDLIRTHRLLRQAALVTAGRQKATVPFRTLFADDIDGVCVVFRLPIPEEMMRNSPTRFRGAIKAIARQGKRDSSWNSDERHWFVHGVKNDRIVQTYILEFKTAIDMQADEERCYDADTPVEVNDSQEGLFIDVSPKRATK